jgi:hypothetical protein
MSTTTPTGSTTPAAAETRSAAGTETNTRTRTDRRTRPGTTATGRSDRWAAPTDEPPTDVCSTAPLTFDPFCGRRLRNCIDGENAAFPGEHRYGRS